VPQQRYGTESMMAGDNLHPAGVKGSGCRGTFLIALAICAVHAPAGPLTPAPQRQESWRTSPNP
jgi:hypothetical protein